MKEFLIILGFLLLVVVLPVAQCSYDNYVKYKVAQAASTVADKK